MKKELLFPCIAIPSNPAVSHQLGLWGVAKRLFKAGCKSTLRYRVLLPMLLAGTSLLATAQTVGAGAPKPHNPAGAPVDKAPKPVKKTNGTAQVQATPVASARTSQILLNTYGDTPLAVPLLATEAGGTIVSYAVTVLPPTASGVLRLVGTAVTTATVITAANAGNLTFDPAAGYFGTAVFQYTAKDAANAVSAAVTYGIPVGKATCGSGVGQANLLSFFARPAGEDWTTANRTVTTGGVTITANPTGTPYTVTANTANSLAVSDQAVMPGKGLVWSTDYSTTTGAKSTTTLTFSRPLANFTLSIGDIDASSPGYFDQLTLQGYDASGNLVAIPAANVATNAAVTSYANNVLTGLSNSTATAADNALVTFPSAIVKLVMTYHNTSTQTDPGLQSGIVFPSVAWCAQAMCKAPSRGPSGPGPAPP